ncbi:MAG: 2,3-bisphosphoglycerate-independent phosphoglycerate mutase, partial [Thermoleophilia bacterium]
RWDRTARALSAMTLESERLIGSDPKPPTARLGEPPQEVGSDPTAVVRASYERGVTDEFIEPVVLSGRPRIAPGDVVIVFNFRPDRARQLTERLLASGFDVVTMTRYRDDFDCPVAFAEQEIVNTLAQVLSQNGLRQLHVAETEKYAHVTYFFNGGREDEWPGELRVLVPSPRDVPSYDHKPEMSAPEVTDRFVEALGAHDPAFAVLNFANPDMVGHTGSIPAAIKAVETVDACLGRVVEAVENRGGACLVTADHGNAEQMLQPDGSPHTAHTTNLVPLVLTGTNASISDGELADLAPAALGLLGLDKPLQMTGKNLISG